MKATMHRRREIMPFKKILYATDFSDASINALPYVLQLRDAGAEEVHLVHVVNELAVSEVVERPGGIGEPAGAFEMELASFLEKDAEERLGQLQRELEEAGYVVKVYLLLGMPGDEIVRLADTLAVSVIVIGSHGHGSLAGILLGSVSDYVVHHASQPVLVVRWTGQSG
jgi:nucleotide-binding universal stress UspA family protein